MKVIIIGAGAIGSVSALQEAIKNISIDDVFSINERVIETRTINTADSLLIIKNIPNHLVNDYSEEDDIFFDSL